MPRILGMTVGLPLSGKSTWLDRLKMWQKVCPDDIRLAMGHEFYGPIEPMVWAIAETVVRAHLIRGHHVMVDATNITQWERARWKKLAEEYGAEAVAYVGFAPRSVCVARAIKDDRRYMIDIIDKMAGKYQPVIAETEAIEVLPVDIGEYNA